MVMECLVRKAEASAELVAVMAIWAGGGKARGVGSDKGAEADG